MGGTEAGLIGEAGAAAKTREAEAVALERGRAALVAAVRRVRRQIKEPMRGAASKDSLDSLRQDITAAEAALVNYKNDQRRGYELLRQSEVSLNRDLELFAETIESWEHDNDLPLDMSAIQRPKKRLGARARATSATPQAAAAGGLSPEDRQKMIVQLREQKVVRGCRAGLREARSVTRGAV